MARKYQLQRLKLKDLISLKEIAHFYDRRPTNIILSILKVDQQLLMVLFQIATLKRTLLQKKHGIVTQVIFSSINVVGVLRRHLVLWMSYMVFCF